MIDSGGMKIYPRDAEEVVVRHTAVRDVAAFFRVSHEHWGGPPSQR